MKAISKCSITFVALALMVAIFAHGPAQAQTLTTLHTFTGSPDGANPYAGLIRDSQGNFYSTTYSGGAGRCTNQGGCGTIFKLDTDGNETVLYSFKGGVAGAHPTAGLIQDAKGNFYGTTLLGGIDQCHQTYVYGCGTAFKLDAAGKETLLHEFCSAPKCEDGTLPSGSLLLDAAENTYGTAEYAGPHELGVVFKLDAAGHETLVYSFIGRSNGADPVGGLIPDHKGNFYGVTSAGDRFDAGTVYELDAAGHEIVLYRFMGTWDGNAPTGGLIRDAAGNLYGTTSFGGVGNIGVVFRVSALGKETVLHSFAGNPDGALPNGNLIRDAQGNLYGTSNAGGAYNSGTIFKIDASGNETVLYNFTGGTDGGWPIAGLLSDGQGSLYGTTFGGGDAGCSNNGSIGCGTVFKFTP